MLLKVSRSACSPGCNVLKSLLLELPGESAPKNPILQRVPKGKLLKIWSDVYSPGCDLLGIGFRWHVMLDMVVHDGLCYA